MEKEIAQLQASLNKIKLEQQVKVEEEKLQVQDMVSFFSDWSELTQGTNTELVSIKPGQAQSTGGTTFRQIPLEILVKGTYNSIADLLAYLELRQRLPDIKDFQIKLAEAGYPELELKISLNLPVR